MTAEVALATCDLCGADVTTNAELRWVRDGYPIVRCRQCSLLFRRDLPSPDEIAALYATDYFTSSGTLPKGEGYLDYTADEELHRRNARQRLALLEEFVASGALLDVGCAAGFFLDEAAQAGWAVAGVELAPSMAAVARDRLGLNVVEAPFGVADFADESFDCVTMWDYVEHSLDPIGDLRRAHDLLRPGGVLALSTGDAGSPIARISGRRWHLLTPRHHNFFFTRATLERAFTEAGLRLRTMTTLASRYSFAYLAHKLQTMSGLPFLDRVALALRESTVGQVSVPVNLFDIVVAVAERPRP